MLTFVSIGGGPSYATTSSAACAGVSTKSAISATGGTSRFFIELVSRWVTVVFFRVFGSGLQMGLTRPSVYTNVYSLPYIRMRMDEVHE
jgi:hypothetical protein